MPIRVETYACIDRWEESTMMMTRSALILMVASGAVPLLVVGSGCGGTASTASRSAAAYDEARRNGVAVGGAEHGAAEGHSEGGHAAGPSPQTGTASPAMPGMDHSSMPGMKSDRSATERRPMAEMNHSGMAATGMPPQTRTDPHAAMDHSQMPGMSRDMPMSPPSPEPLSATARPGQTAETLQPDPLDQPPPTSVADAARSAAMAAEMSGGGHGMSHGVYRHVDAGRDAMAPSPKPSPQVKEHKH